MIYFIKNTVVGVWLDGEIIAVVSPDNDSYEKQSHAICTAILEHLSANSVSITGLFEFKPGMGEEKAEVSVHIFEDDGDRYETIELTCITQY